MPMASKTFCNQSFGEESQRRACSESNLNFSSPIPSSAIFLKQKTFSLKKERPPNYNDKPPPTPKTRLDSSLLFGSKTKCPRPHSISFIHSETLLVSKYYDEKSDDPYFNQCFDIISKLGTGSFGEVFKVMCKDDKKYYAVKRSKEKFRGQSDRLRKIEEVRKYERLPKHQNCVKFYKAWEEKGLLYIQLELCDFSLSQYAEENHEIPEHVIWHYLVDLLLASKHLHDHNFVHLDIKPENIFVSRNGICKLGDFGLMLDLTKLNKVEAVEGDSKYLAPELMSGIFTKAADVFSLGITILELASDLDLPQGDDTWHQLRQKQIPMEFLKNLSPELIEIIQIMMEPDYKTRPTIDKILSIEAVCKAYGQRKLILQMEEFSTNENHSPPRLNDSYDSNIFFTGNNSFISPESKTYGYFSIPQSPTVKKNLDEVFMEEENPYENCRCNPRLQFMSEYSDRHIPYKISHTYANSSPKLSRRVLTFQHTDTFKDDADDCVPFVKPQKLLDLFDDDSDTSF